MEMGHPDPTSVTGSPPHYGLDKMSRENHCLRASLKQQPKTWNKAAEYVTKNGSMYSTTLGHLIEGELELAETLLRKMSEKSKPKLTFR